MTTKPLTLKPEYDLGTTVYLKVDTEVVGILVGYVVRPKCDLQYLVTWNDAEEKAHWSCELTEEKTL